MLPEGGFGNLIALPLQKEARLSGNSSFVDNDLKVIPDQWQHLAKLDSISHNTLTKLLTQISPNSALFKEQKVIENRPPWEVTAKAKPIKFENPPKAVSITLANHVYFDLSGIPSALAARLRRLERSI
ncbi:TOTE conflict system archaeo-eukaryotic primase domain-containing protein [Teredinibacter franksiae]|uniref:TOTE conflict system archaeo-eukaryotic primase domain-containing protein n=1 Tax=Teredinibacter franksiae TaxID=2761453 RepID=UPI0035E4641F